MAIYKISAADGVSLKFQGVTLPNNSLVDVKDLYYNTPELPEPANTNRLHDQALLCLTDLVDCCESPHTVHGDWYYPDGSVVPSDTIDPYGITLYGRTTFLKNRGPSEVLNCRQFYGSVRLFRRWSKPPGRGRFRCEIPSAANPSVNQILYTNIGEKLQCRIQCQFLPIIIIFHSGF